VVPQGPWGADLFLLLLLLLSYKTINKRSTCQKVRNIESKYFSEG
jgi:hypothetical protein